MIGVDPGPLTLRELLWMSDGRGKHAWSQTCSIVAAIANAFRDPKKSKPIMPDDINPYTIADRRENEIEVTSMSEIRKLFKG